MERRISTWVIPILLLLLLLFSVSSEQDNVRHSLVGFLRKLAAENTEIERKLGWDANSDPCKDGWTGVDCNKAKEKVLRIVLERLELGGSINAGLLCNVQSLTVVSLRDNAIQGELPVEISNCSKLTHLYVGGNRLSGRLPSSLSLLNNLKRLNISSNNFSGDLPDLSVISGLLTFLAPNNHFTGHIPHFDFANLSSFNVSNNLLTGPVPENGDRFGIDCYMGNLDLCGTPFPNACPPNPSPPEEDKRDKNRTTDKVVMYLGYIILGLVILIFLAYKLIYRRRKTRKNNKADDGEKVDESNTKPSNGSSAHKTGASRSEYSLTAAGETAGTLTSLVVLQNPATNELRFEDLLKAPAELLGRGRFGSLYKVMLQDGTSLAVKRIKDFSIAAEDFARRMQRIDRAKHPNLLPPIAFYCSTHEKLVVYEYQKDGSLFKLLHDSTKGKNFDWSNRLNVAAGIAEGLAFMHHELQEDAIGHGNLKSSNILMKTNMNPCISEYGLTSTANNNHDISSQSNGGQASNASKDTSSIQDHTLKADVYGFGVILLELLTGKVVQNNGAADLARWVHPVVREEWTVEVFDKALLSDGANEESMVHLLQLALKCINSSPDARPSMSQVAAMINAIKEEEEEEEETSIVSEA